jgi:hypothetical protein
MLPNLPTKSLLNPNPNLLDPYQGCSGTRDHEEEELSWKENVDDFPESESEPDPKE